VSREVEPRAAAALIAEGALAVDVRDAAELEEDGYLEGAQHVPLVELSARAGELPAGRPLVLICRSGTRSAMAAAALHASGFEAYSVGGGILAWQRDGLPVARINP
jgi:rhodanese-related sulfurtransferase